MLGLLLLSPAAGAIPAVQDVAPPVEVRALGLGSALGLRSSPDGQNLVVWDGQRAVVSTPTGAQRYRWRLGPIDAAVGDDGSVAFVFPDEVRTPWGRVLGEVDQAVWFDGALYLRQEHAVLAVSEAGSDPVEHPGHAMGLWATPERVVVRHVEPGELNPMNTVIAGSPGGSPLFEGPQVPELWGAAGVALGPESSVWRTDGPRAVRVVTVASQRSPVSALSVAARGPLGAMPLADDACEAGGMLWRVVDAGWSATEASSPQSEIVDGVARGERLERIFMSRTSSGVDAPQRTHVACHGDDRWMSADGDIGDYPHPPVVRRAPPVDRLALSAEAVYVAWPDDRIDAYSRDGTPRWTVWPHDPGESVTALLAVPGGVVSGGLDAAVVALDEAGAELWRERAPGWGPRLATDGSSVLAATPDGVWLRPLAVDGSLTELPMTGTVDVAWRDGSWWLSTADGSVVQRAPDLSLVARHLGAPPIRALSWDGDVVVAGDDDGRIGRWSADGALLDLTCAQRDPVQPASSPRIERRGDRYVVGGRSFALPIGAAQVDGRRLAVGLVDGHVVWPGGTAELGRPVTAIALGPDERLAVATVDGTLWLYDGEWVGRRPDGSCPAP